MSLLDSAIVRLLPAVPKPVVQHFSARYIAGATLEEAVAVVRDLNAGGKMATVDVLGEEITREDETRAIAQAYRDVLAAIAEASLDSNVSIKPTALGLGLSYELCRENLLDILRRGNFVRIDMEDSTTTDDTLRLYRELREDGHDNVGVVLQARLRRTLDDIAALAELRPSVRICKGIYLERAAVAFTDDEAIRVNFLRCLDALLRRRFVRRHRDARRVADRRVARARRTARAGARGVRAADAPRRARGAARRARRGGPSPARLRPVRRAVVRVLGAPPAGEPRDGRDDREGDSEPAAPRPVNDSRD